MRVRRVVPHLQSTSTALSRNAEFYGVLGFEQVMNGVRRFFVRDPDGRVVDVLGHR